MTEQQRPALQTVKRDGDDIVLRGSTPNAGRGAGRMNEEQAAQKFASWKAEMEEAEELLAMTGSARLQDAIEGVICDLERMQPSEPTQGYCGRCGLAVGASWQVCERCDFTLVERKPQVSDEEWAAFEAEIRKKSA